MGEQDCGAVGMSAVAYSDVSIGQGGDLDVSLTPACGKHVSCGSRRTRVVVRTVGSARLRSAVQEVEDSLVDVSWALNHHEMSYALDQLRL